MAGVRAELSQDERLARIRLARSENVGPVTFLRLIERCGSAIAALDMLPELARRGGRKSAPKLASAQDATAEIQAVEKLGGQLIIFGDAAYPAPLAAIADPPPVINVLGHAHMLERPRQLAIVGSRNASTIGRKLAGELAREAGAAGWTIVSGLARGIDGAAHAASLESGTVAVVAGGADIIYPPEHDALRDNIIATGALVAEMPPQTEPIGRLFPRRNRIIAGLSMGTVVVEGAVKSGSLITARLAAEQGREVFAVPGSPMDQRCRGPNRLLKDGAHLVEDARDVLDVLERLQPRDLHSPDLFSYQPAKRNETIEDIDDSVRDTVLQALSSVPVTVDELIRDCQLSAPEVLTALIELELAGKVGHWTGGRVCLTGSPDGDG